MKRLNVKASKYFQTKYNGLTDCISEEHFSVEKSCFFRPWRLTSDYGIGFKPGDVFDLYPLKEGIHAVPHGEYWLVVEANKA